MNEMTNTDTKKNAGEIWKILNRTVTGVSIQELCRQLTLTFDEVISAVRWLAKDINIGLANDNNGQLVVIGV